MTSVPLTEQASYVQTDKVTVYMPSAGRNCVRNAVESVLTQQYENFELLVVDDSISGDVHLHITDLLKSDSRLQVLRNTRTTGACGARNTALTASTGFFVTGIDDDDLMLPHRIQTMVNAWNDNYSLVFCGHLRRTENIDHPVPIPKSKVELNDILHYNLIGNQVLTRRDYIHQAGLFDEAMPAYQDYDMWVRLIETHGSALGVNTNNYVFIQNSTNRISRDRSRRRRAWLHFVKKHRTLLSPAHKQSLALVAIKEQRKKPSICKLLVLLNRWNWRLVFVQLRDRSFYRKNIFRNQST